MKIHSKHFTGNDYGEYECLVLYIDGKEYMSFSGGEPEDNTLGRDLNFVFDIPDMIKLGYDAAKRGEGIEITSEEVEGRRDD